jgi:hypothetical protein
MGKEWPELNDRIKDHEYIEQWLKSNNFDPDVWEVTKVYDETPKDKQILVGDFVGVNFDRKKGRVEFARVSCIRNGRMFLNQLKDKQARRVHSLPYRTRRHVHLVVRTKRNGFKSSEKEIFFRGMKMSPEINLRDEPLETCEEKCPFCGTRKNLTLAGGTARYLRDFLYIDFCERCKCLLYFFYDVDVGPIVNISYRRRIDTGERRMSQHSGRNMPACGSGTLNPIYLYVPLS